MKTKTIIGMAVMLMALVGMTACDKEHDDNPGSGNTTTQESLYGEWWLVGWNDGGIWFEVDTNYVSHHCFSIEIPEEGYMMAYSAVNEIFVGVLTLNGNEMIFGGEGKGSMTKVGCSLIENEFFEKHICDIKAYQIEGKQVKLYYTDKDYFVFTKDFDDSEEHRYEWKNGPADPYIGEVTAINEGEVEVKIINSPSFTSYYSRTAPPTSNNEICHFAASDLAGLSYEVGDKVAFRIVQLKRLKVEKGREFQLKVEPSKGSEHIIDHTGMLHNDQRMGWTIIDDELSERQGGIYYYPLKVLAEEYLTEGQPVKFSGELYSTWRMPWDNQGHSDCYYIDIDAIELSSLQGPLVAIDETNFPDAAFREWMMKNYKWAYDGVLTEKEIEEVRSMDINSVIIKTLKGIELFTNLTKLKIVGNLSEVDFSKNTELTYLNIYNRELSSIDLSCNIKLESLYLGNHDLETIDLSNNLKLKILDLRNNKLEAIDLSRNVELEEVYLGFNHLSSLDLTGLKKLSYVDCYNNKIKGEAMDALIASLSSECPNIFCVIDTSSHTEKNVITKTQVAAAKDKGWNVQDYAGGKYQDYLCSDD